MSKVTDEEVEREADDIEKMLRSGWVRRELARALARDMLERVERAITAEQYISAGLQLGEGRLWKDRAKVAETRLASIFMAGGEVKEAKKRVVCSNQSPLNPLRWSCELECGHAAWVTAWRRPKVATCGVCTLKVAK